MLVLTRKNRESVVIGRPEDHTIVLEITVLEIDGGRVRLGFHAEAQLPIHRREVWNRICNGEVTRGATPATVSAATGNGNGNGNGNGDGNGHVTVIDGIAARRS